MYKIKESVELFMIIILVVACHVVKNTESPLLPAFDKEGHRGCRGLMPENTVPAMLRALDLGVTTLEMDVVITKDRKVILSHEPFFNHDITTKPNGEYVSKEEERSLNIFTMTYDSTQQYDVGMKPHPSFPRQQKIPATKPLLKEVISEVEAAIRLKRIGKVFYNIETKTNPATDNVYHPEPEEFVTLLMDVLEKNDIEDRVIIQSFDFRTLKLIHQKYPDIKTAALIEGSDKRSLESHIEELGFTPTIYSPNQSLVNSELVEQCHQRDILIVPWTINELDKMESLRKTGVDGVISDYPDLFSKL